MIDRERHLTGLIAAPHTPMNPDGSVDLAANGVKGVCVCGTRGEFASLTVADVPRGVPPDMKGQVE